MLFTYRSCYNILEAVRHRFLANFGFLPTKKQILVAAIMSYPDLDMLFLCTHLAKYDRNKM